MDVVRNVLEKSALESDRFRSIEVNKLVDIDAGALLSVDSNPIDSRALKSSPNSYLLNLTRDNVQLLFNEIWTLPTERVEDAIVAKLPKQKFRLPRFREVPRPRQLTKWEQFAKDKGIVKKKKSKLTWDEQLKKWIPLYGFKRTQAQDEKQWLLEVPQNANPMEDQFAKKAEAKSEKVAKNELQRLRNIAKIKNVKVPRFGVTNPEVSSSKDLQAAVSIAKASTASLGKFQDKLPNEKPARGISDITPGANRKRKLPPVSAKDEQAHNLSIVEDVLAKRPRINNEISKPHHVVEQVESEQNKKRKNVSKPNNARKPKGKPSGKPKGKSKPRKGKVMGGRKRR